MTEIKKELEAIHSIKSKGAGDEEEFVLGQHYPPGVIGMKQLVKCWEYHLKENKRLQKEADGMNKPLCDKIDELIYDNDILKEEIKELNKKKGVKWSREFAMPLIEELKEDLVSAMEEIKEWRVNFKEEKEERIKLSRELLKYTKGWVEKNDKGKITKKHHSYKRLQELYDKYSPHRNKMREFQLLDDD